MKCPKCGYNTLDWAETCKRCGSILSPKIKSKITFQNAQGEKGRVDHGYKSSVDYKTTTGKRERAKKLSDISHSFQSGRYEETPPSDELPKFRQSKRIILHDEKFETVESPDPSPVLLPGYEEPLPGEDFGLERSFYESEQLDKEAGSYNSAGVGSRAAAFIIDLILLSGVSMIVLGGGMSVAGIPFDASAGTRELIWSYAGLFLLCSTYFIFLHGAGGKTIGKMICKIKVIQEDGEPIGMKGAFLRWIGYFLSFIFFVGFFWALFDAKGQAWHDKIAKTYVVNEQPLKVPTFLKR